VNSFNWSAAQSTLAGFGGTPVSLHVSKTGLPFFDALRLYGAIDLYIGMREDVSIYDTGTQWEVSGKFRSSILKGKDEAAFQQVWSQKKPKAAAFCVMLRSSLVNGVPFPETEQKWPHAIKALAGLDAALQSGIRHTAAASYETLQTGQTSPSTCCVLKIPLSDGVLAFTGKKRIEGVGDITFLPIFEGQIDLSKVVSPLRAWIGVPNVLCAQALALLALKTSLFVEGYQERLKEVVFNTTFSGQRSDNYSGLVTIASTAIGKLRSASFVAHIYRVFRTLVSRAWKRQGRSYQTTSLTPDALAIAYWLMQPIGKHLASMVTSQEHLRREGSQSVFTNADYVKEVFDMSYGGWKGDYEAVQKFARAVSSAIQWARGRDKNGNWLSAEEQRKNWYDEVTILRSAPSAKAFIERAMILIEQGHREHSQIGTAHRDEAYDPKALLNSIGSDRGSEFEVFRDLFRMYLVQASTYQAKEGTMADVSVESPVDNVEATREEEDKE
jgi:hypothetical protein